MPGAAWGRKWPQKLEDLKIWQRAQQFWGAVSPLLQKPGFRRDSELKDQISDALDSVTSNTCEGFDQPTGRSLARFLWTSKASTSEVLARLDAAHRKGYVTQQELRAREDLGDELRRMLHGLIKYLLACDWRDRKMGKPPRQRHRGTTTDD